MLEGEVTIHFLLFTAKKRMINTSQITNSSHSLSCPYYSRVTTGLLYTLNKPLNLLLGQVILISTIFVVISAIVCKVWRVVMSPAAFKLVGIFT